ncbi:hypothetical protein [Streptomyces sp. NPDC026673]|uniref:hypothetical protein n=1 Tax=Streptomyces sp. NPDC026673 TaxID=3155724 RepID=UPI0033D2F134
MTEPAAARPTPRHLTELTDVYDFLDEVRLRPGMWVRGSSLQHLESMLLGYGAAMKVHGIEAAFDFWSPGAQRPFAEWLWRRNGRHSPLGWAVEIEREAQESETPAIELFFSLLDQYRAEQLPVR